MTPDRVPGSKNYRCDVVTPIGRIRRSLRTSSLREYHRRLALIDKLLEAADYDTLRMFKRGEVSITELRAADRRGELHSIRETRGVRRLIVPAMNAWLPHSAKAKQSRRRYAVSWRRFCEKAGITPHHTIEDLATVDYDELRANWEASASDWNKARALISRFLSRHLALHHPVRLKVMEKFEGQAPTKGRMPKVSPTRFWEIVNAAEERLRPTFVAMAVLGTRPAEYFALERIDLDRENRAVHIRGTKTRSADRWVAVDSRMWLWVDSAVPAPLQSRWTNRWWKRACAKVGETDFRLMDLRHLSAQYAGNMGASDRDLAVHLGHSDPKMTHRYSEVQTARRVAKAAADALLEAM